MVSKVLVGMANLAVSTCLLADADDVIKRPQLLVLSGVL